MPVTDEIQRRLSDLAGADARADGSRHLIKDRAEALLAEARAKMDELRPRVMTDAAAAAEYQEKAADIGRLEQVLALADRG